MKISADTIEHKVSPSGLESLVFEHYDDQGLARRVTVELGSSGAEDLVVRASELLKARRQRMERLERYLASAVEESRR